MTENENVYSLDTKREMRRAEHLGSLGLRAALQNKYPDASSDKIDSMLHHPAYSQLKPKPA